MLIVINGEPIPKKRHRCMCIGRHARAYDEQSREEMPYIRALMTDALKKIFESDDKQIVIEASNLTKAKSLIVSLRFYLGVNESDSEARKNAKLWGLIEANIKPDFDNLIKFYCDCANGVLWSDDKIITKGAWSKEFSENPRTEIEIMSKKEFTSDRKTMAIMKIFSPALLKDLLNDICVLGKTFSSCEIDKILDSDDIEEKEIYLSQLSALLVGFAEKYEPSLRKIRNVAQMKEIVERVVKVK